MTTFMNKPGATGLKRLRNASIYSYQGLKSTWADEAAFRQEVIVLCIAIPIILAMNCHAYEKIALFVSILLVMLVELLNSAIESIVDRIGPEHHTLSGKAKDIGSASVSVAIFIAMLTWGSILLINYTNW